MRGVSSDILQKYYSVLRLDFCVFGPMACSLCSVAVPPIFCQVVMKESYPRTFV
jgi:hypothetical protein